MDHNKNLSRFPSAIHLSHLVHHPWQRWHVLTLCTNVLLLRHSTTNQNPEFLSDHSWTKISIFYSLYRNIWPLQLDNVYITVYSNLDTSIAPLLQLTRHQLMVSDPHDTTSHSSEIMLWKVRCDHRQDQEGTLNLNYPSTELEETSWTAKAQMDLDSRGKSSWTSVYTQSAYKLNTETTCE